MPLIIFPLQTIRVVFRLLFAVPLVILAIDGVRPHHHINDTMYVQSMSGFSTRAYSFPTSQVWNRYVLNIAKDKTPFQ